MLDNSFKFLSLGIHIQNVFRGETVPSRIKKTKYWCRIFLLKHIRTVLNIKKLHKQIVYQNAQKKKRKPEQERSMLTECFKVL